MHAEQVSIMARRGTVGFHEDITTGCNPTSLHESKDINSFKTLCYTSFFHALSHVFLPVPRQSYIPLCSHEPRPFVMPQARLHPLLMPDISNLAHLKPQSRLSVFTSLMQFSIYLPFLLSASLFLKGNPLVRLSAPVFLLILPLLLANRMHQNATAARKVEPSVPRLKLRTPVWVHMP